MATLIKKNQGLLQAASPGIRKRLRRHDPEPPRALQGLRTGESLMPDLAYIQTFAQADELKSFRQAIQARRSRDLSTWKILPDGTRMKPGDLYFRCNRCGYGAPYPPAPPFPCSACNLPGYVEGGHMIPLDDAERDRFLTEKKAKRDEAQAREWNAAFYRRNEERKKAGLPALTKAEFRTEQKRDFDALNRTRTMGAKK